MMAEDKTNIEPADVVEAARRRAVEGVMDPALALQAQAAAIIDHHAGWAVHVPATRRRELAAALAACAEEMKEPIRRGDQEGMRRVAADWWRKITVLSTPLIEPTQREQHERALQQIWGHGGRYNCAFEVSVLFDYVIRSTERIAGYDHRSVTLADQAGVERVVSRDAVREAGRPGWAYTSPGWHEGGYQAQFTPIDAPAAEPEPVGRIGGEFVHGNGFGPAVRRGV
jgi:hypothetical protein